MALAYELEYQLSAASDLQMAVLQRCDPVGLVGRSALFAAHADVELIDKTDHESEDLFTRKTFKRKMLVRGLAKLWKEGAEALDLFEFLFLLPGRELRM